MSKKVIKRKSATKSINIPVKGLSAKVALAEAMTPKIEYPDFRAGDQVKVHVRIKEGDKERVQIFEGLVIGRDNKGGSKSFRVRKVAHGVGVERIFLETSPKVAKLEVVQRGKVRRAKLYYIRELEGRAARIEREVETQTQSAARAAAKTTKAET
jgi:large subunit ribosomal protein L19